MSSKIERTMTIDRDITLLNASQLAKAMGVPPNYITRMKRAGFPMPDSRSTIAEALVWRRENPTYHLPKTKEHPRDVLDRLDEASGK